MRKTSLLLVLCLAVGPAAATPAVAAPLQTVSGRITAADGTDGELARRTYLSTAGAVNGTAGYAFPVDARTRGGWFTLELTATVGGGPKVSFYDDIVTGDLCGVSAASGEVCGSHAVITFSEGVDASFTYTAGPPPPTWQPPEGSTPATGTYIYLESIAGDFIGQGKTYLYTLGDALIAVDEEAGRISIGVDGNEQWTGNFKLPDRYGRAQQGYWPDVQRYPVHDKAAGGLSWSGEGRACSKLLGWFAIDAISYRDDALESVTLRFEQRCGGRSPLYGKIVWDVDDEGTVPPPGPVPDWQPVAGSTPSSGSYIYLQSPPGDYIGGGRTYLYTLTDALLDANEASGLVYTQVRGDQRWNGYFKLPDRYTMAQPGHWTNVQRYPFHNKIMGGLDWEGEGRGCSRLLGWFVIDAISYRDDALESITLRFEQRCEETGPPLRGKIEWHVDDEALPVDNGPPPDWQPPAGSTPASGSYVYLESASGDYIGLGENYLYTLSDSELRVSEANGSVTTSVDGDEWWNGSFALPHHYERAVTGYWPDVQRAGTHNPVKGGLDWYGDGRGCNRLKGWFAIDSLTYRNESVEAITLRFEQRCEETGPPLRGKIVWHVDDTAEDVDPGPPPPWQPPAGSTPETGSYVYLASETGDYIGQGKTYLYTPAVATITAGESTGLITVSIRGSERWDGRFKLPSRYQRAVAGYWPDVQRYPFHNTVKGGLSWDGEGRGCNELRGWFSIDDITYRDNALASLTLRFEQLCEETDPPLRGKIVWSIAQ